MVITFLESLMFYQFSLSLQVKESLIISNKLVCELPHELPNDLRLWKVQNNVKTSWNYTLVPNLPPKKNTSNTVNSRKRLPENRN